MRVRELEKLIIDAIQAADLPGLTDIKGGDADKHTRVRMLFDDGSRGAVMVRNVTPPGGTRTADYDMDGVL